MYNRSFPVDPTTRRAVVVVGEADIQQILASPDAGAFLFGDEAYVLQFPVESGGELPAALQNILNAQLTRPGSVLVQSPFDPDTYQDVADAPQRFALEKQLYFSQFCMHLGAKEVNVEQIAIGTRTGRILIDLSLPVPKVPGAQVNALLENDVLEKFRNEMQLHLKFAGGTPDVDSAERLLREKNLITDPSMRPLLEMRRGGTNQLLEHRLVLNLSSETRSNFKVAASLKLPALLKFSNEFSRLVQEQIEYALTVVVRF